MLDDYDLQVFSATKSKSRDDAVMEITANTVLHCEKRGPVIKFKVSHYFPMYDKFSQLKESMFSIVYSD